MDSTPEDDVLVISQFLSRLQSTLVEESEVTTAVETQLKELSNKLDISYDEIIASTETPNAHDIRDLESVLPSSVQENINIRRENVELLLALQREDYLRSNYEKLLSEHQDLMDSISNSIVNRKSYVEMRHTNDESAFKSKCSKLEIEAANLRTENERYDALFKKTMAGIEAKAKELEQNLSKDDKEELEVRNRLGKLRTAIEAGEMT